MKTQVKVTNRQQSGEVAGAAGGEVVSGDGPVIVIGEQGPENMAKQRDEIMEAIRRIERTKIEPLPYMDLAGFERRAHIEMFLWGAFLGVVFGAGVASLIWANLIR